MAISVPVPMAMPTLAWVRAGRVVDAVADHRHRPKRAPAAADLGHLALGQHLGQHVVNAGLPGDGLGGAAVIAGDHGRLQTQGCRARMASAASFSVSATAMNA
jgi:hypothetical protein